MNNMAIPKKIHYCWFGRGEKPELAKKCIESWKKYCPDYEFKEWNEDNFDIHSNKYVEQAYNARKFAFVTDYVRLYALYYEGGVYMDTDVEVLKPIDEFLKHKAFSSFENNNTIPTGLMASEKGNEWIKDLLDEYTDLNFIDEDGNMDLTTNVTRITNLTHEKYGLKLESSYQELKNGVVTLYPYDYFCPKDWSTGEIHLTENSATIHHFSGSWHTAEEKEKANIYREKLKKYIAKYHDEDIAREKLNKDELRKFYLKHPLKAAKKIIEKMKGK